MNLIKFEEVAEITAGKNATRINDENVEFYTPEDFDNDLKSRNDKLTYDKIIISLIKTKAAPLSKEMAEKFITSNFLICSFDKEKFDPWYLCYQFNEGKTVERQLNKVNQGSTLSVRKVNVKIISDLEMPIIPLDKQKAIGELYKKSIIQSELLKEKISLLNKLTLGTIRKIEED